ncbi:2'-5' RNA ligase family protein [Micromonospora sp. HM5-17]|uniref:2'-5' RNA ligase family protein n=1 Tax=Micromonospora sp. HM5-17 TaxID=2487710 RepID=UPI000F475821|nr:2'-5' RNA ligase family protein [Micromonospora sp. HM5-17]ROT32464.1 2'-5' RNA ligase family protein [Micromonospora sp. HM5-17]
MTTVEHVDTMRDHWWWRPGWRVGRHYYACHFDMGRHRELVALVERYQQAIGEFPGLDLIPHRWLHLTTQGVGFLDDLAAESIDRLVGVVADRLAEVPAPVVTFHRPTVRGEAVYLLADPAEPVAAVRSAVRAAIAEALGEERVEQAAEGPAGFRPHVSIAYSNREQPGAPIAEALEKVMTEPVTVVLDQIELLEYHRDRRMYEWTEARPLRIGR